MKEFKAAWKQLEKDVAHLSTPASYSRVLESSMNVRKILSQAPYLHDSLHTELLDFEEGLMHGLRLENHEVLKKEFSRLSPSLAAPVKLRPVTPVLESYLHARSRLLSFLKCSEVSVLYKNECKRALGDMAYALSLFSKTHGGRAAYEAEALANKLSSLNVFHQEDARMLRGLEHLERPLAKEIKLL